MSGSERWDCPCVARYGSGFRGLRKRPVGRYARLTGEHKGLDIMGVRRVNGHYRKKNKGKVVESMKNDLEKKYVVRHTGGREIIVPAKSAREAKRQACKFWGYIACNRLIGIKACSAKLVPTSMG